MHRLRERGREMTEIRSDRMIRYVTRDEIKVDIVSVVVVMLKDLAKALFAA